VSPILVRPIREQFEHDRIIRVLQGRYKRKYDVTINPGAEQNASVAIGEIAMYPDVVLFGVDRGRRLQGTVEVETTESINTLEAMAEWGPFSRLRAPFFLYVPPSSVDTVRRLCAEHHVNAAEIWTYHTAADQVRFTMVYRSPEMAAAVARMSSAAKPEKKLAKRPAKKPVPVRKPGAVTKPTKTAGASSTAKAPKQPPSKAAPKKAAKALKRR
jgi:hypothetical protein